MLKYFRNAWFGSVYRRNEGREGDVRSVADTHTTEPYRSDAWVQERRLNFMFRTEDRYFNYLNPTNNVAIGALLVVLIAQELLNPPNNGLSVRLEILMLMSHSMLSTCIKDKLHENRVNVIFLPGLTGPLRKLVKFLD
ncbi:hypothetical protein evm_004918 [Chilo suppressalis]|nr:hypothetical protein evm_004918 [Chilo suppressalis]